MQRDLIWLSALAAAAFAVLAGLGLWQLQRLAWKHDLIARIEARSQTAPVPLDMALTEWRHGGDVDYLRVRVEGRFHHDDERHLFSVIGGETGWEVITPLETAGGRIVMVNRGFVPNALKQPEARGEGQVAGILTLTGLARTPGTQGLFTPDNSPVTNTWYWRDLEGMAASVPTARDPESLVPFFIEADNSPVPGGWPKGGVTRVSFPNRHLQYALTWFGLAVALLIVLALYVRARIQRRAFT